MNPFVVRFSVCRDTEAAIATDDAMTSSLCNNKTNSLNEQECDKVGHLTHFSCQISENLLQCNRCKWKNSHKYVDTPTFGLFFRALVLRLNSC